MAEMDRGDIPSGLNRIKTRRVPLEDSSGGDDSPARPVARLDERAASGARGPRTSDDSTGSRRSGDAKGFRKGKKIARWLSSYLTVNNSNKISGNSPELETKKPEVKMPRKGLVGSKQSVDLEDVTRKRSMYGSNFMKKMPEGKKSFSHELGPRGGIRPSQPRARSYSDLKELLGSLHSKCHAAKEVVNVELAAFASDVAEILEEDLLSETKGPTKDLLLLAQNCIEMSCNEFREICEGIVQELAERRLHCQAEVLKQLFTRMLFIVTRYTRLLQFQKDGGVISEDSLHKFRECLESIPVIEMGWSQKPGKPAAGWTETPSQINTRPNQYPKLPEIASDPTENHGMDGMKSFPPQPHEDSLPGEGSMRHSLESLREQEESSEELDEVICRICEVYVPTANLESHSYICAYADKCDLEGLDVDDRLAKMSELLEQICESHAQNINASCSSPETSRIQNVSSVNGSNNQSPKVVEWHNKGLEGMFEDLHEMDTAFLDDSQSSNFNNLKGCLSMKLGSSVAFSSNESMTPASSTSTPRANHFDLFWLEHGNPSHLEDANQINKLAQIARKVENIDLKMGGGLEHLKTCIHNVCNVLYHNKKKGLVVDTFGSRLKSLLEGKYRLAMEHADHKGSDEVRQLEEGGGCSTDHSFQSTNSTPSYLSHKERTSIDDFDVIKPISRGAFGEVFLARKRTTGDLFAIKVLKKLHMIRKNDIERILAERNILITVRNPFVVSDLYSLLRKVGCLEEDIARVYIAELVLALEYLHSLGIVHRDLKPDNILIARDGHIKLTDFGLSQIGLINTAVDLSGSGKDACKEQKGSRHSAVGTPDYLAPEILLGTAHGNAADWWSVGIILFEFLTGIPPFTAELPERIFENILNRKIPWPDIPSEMSLEAKDLIERLLIQDPDLRLGANGASEVKAHPFFRTVDWGNLALQKAAFIPNPDSADDTSYFLSRYSSTSLQTPEDPNSSDCPSEATDSSSHYEVDQSCEWRDLSSSPRVDLSGINFSFKNLSQLASMNYDVLLQSGRLPKSSSPLKGPSSQP
ncbi:unnamed protein product [Spirodela intermedia]|uniref:non-specific serine/threonine protein kinase n=1 Tax=Spirodela intermedia TaxID=51605 RepID=A0A7I8JCI1_SPIIN|nr:unnamed protein product [Spirodela intermedia]CAA6667435.1 unnamed protein product [Spirodela intermedia]